MNTADVVIVGGGVIGLSIAYALAREGVRCAVLDQGELGRAASWAGAGIIAPAPEREPKSPSAALRYLSARLHEEWAKSLRAQTGIDNGYRRSGGVDVAWDENEDHDLRALAGQWRNEGIAFERIEPADFSRVEPELNPDIRVAYFIPDRAQIRNPWHLRLDRGVWSGWACGSFHHRHALGFETRAERVVGIRTPRSDFLM